MALLTVFSDNLDPQNGSLTSRFTNATAFYIDAPMQPAEMEIDVFLQVYLTIETGERLRNLRIGSLKDGEIKLNETDTETVVPIPTEFLDSSLEMALYFLTSEPIYLEVYVLGREVTVKSIDEKLDAISALLNDLATANQNNNIDLLTELVSQLLGIDAGIFNVATVRCHWHRADYSPRLKDNHFDKLLNDVNQSIATFYNANFRQN